MKKGLTLLLAGFMVITNLAACSPKTADDSPAGQGAETEQVTELVFWHNRGGSTGELLEQVIIPEFNETKGRELGIKITPVYQGSADLISKFKALILAKDEENLPDIIQTFAGDSEFMSTIEYVLPIEELIEKDSSFKKEDILPQLLNTYTINGQLYSLPFHASTMMMYYNKTAFESAGLDAETGPATLEEVTEAAQKLLVKEGDSVKRYGITMGINNTYLNHFIGGQGQYSYIGNQENGRAGRMTKVEFDTNGTMERFLTAYQKMLDTGAVQTVDEGNQARDEFLAGTSAMLFSSNNVLGSMLSAAKEGGWELGVAPLPKVSASDGGSVCPGGSSVYVLNKGNEDNIQKSWEFIKYWVSPETQTTWSIGSGCIPVNVKSMETDKMKAYTEETPEFWVAYHAMVNSDPHVQEHLAPTKEAVTTIFKEKGERFIAGELDVKQCVEEMAAACNASLDEYNRANPVKQ